MRQVVNRDRAPRPLSSDIVTTTTLVTGGAGYIGAHAVRALTNAGHEVVVLDSMELGNADRVSGVATVVGDIADEPLVEATLRAHGVSTILHLAAYKSVAESMRDPGKYFRNNVAGTIHLLDAAVRAGVEQVVFSSSAAVYGSPSLVPVDESQTLAPESVYAESKVMVEHILRWYGEVYDLRSVSLRYFNAAGASFDGRLGENWDHAANLIPLAIRACLFGGDALQVFGSDYPTHDGTCLRDFVHVEDLASAHVAAAAYLAGGGSSTALNVGTGVASSVFDVLSGIDTAANRPVPYEVVARRVGDPAISFANPRKASNVLGWRSQYTLDDILMSAVQWHDSQRKSV